jgi:hypothetical protein
MVSLLEGAASQRSHTRGYQSHAEQQGQRKDQKKFGAERHNSLFLFKAEFAIRRRSRRYSSPNAIAIPSAAYPNHSLPNA